MKKLFIFLLFVTFNYCAKSQLNHFLPDSNGYISISPYKFLFEGDTVIKNLKYKKVLYQAGDSSVNFNLAYYFAAVREDTLNEKIYCIQTDDGVERVIANFNVNVGDTVSIFSYWPSLYEATEDTVVITSVDYVLINGQAHKQVTIDSKYRFSKTDGVTETWIEGIGSSFGLFFPKGNRGIVDGGEETRLLCIHQDDVLIYQTNISPECYLDFFPEKIKKEYIGSLDIYPTIVIDKLIIRNNKFSKNTYYQILNNNGQLLINNKLIDTILDLSKLENGSYIILINDIENNKRYSNKFIKNK